MDGLFHSISLVLVPYEWITIAVSSQTKLVEGHVVAGAHIFVADGGAKLNSTEAVGSDKLLQEKPGP